MHSYYTRPDPCGPRQNVYLNAAEDRGPIATNYIIKQRDLPVYTLQLVAAL